MSPGPMAGFGRGLRLESFWEGAIPGIDSPDAFAPDGVVVQFGQPPNRIDFINAIDGVSFEEDV